MDINTELYYTKKWIDKNKRNKIKKNMNKY